MKRAFLSLFALVILAGCTSQMPIQPESNRGFSLSPKSYNQSDFLGFFEKVKGGYLSWAGDWFTLKDENGAHMVVNKLASQYDFTPITILNFYSQETDTLNRPFTSKNLADYKLSAIDFAQKNQPKYLGIGIEVNILAEILPQDFETYVTLYNEVYDAIKNVSPNTQVFPIFQLERMKGLKGGLFGGENDPTQSEWELVSRFKHDLVAFTTYPFLVYKNPSEIPLDYYADVDKRFSEPIAFVEVGWPGDMKIQGWESNSTEQAEFIKVFLNQTHDRNIEFAIWSFMYDQNYQKPFDTIGLFSKEGNQRPGYDLWSWNHV